MLILLHALPQSVGAVPLTLVLTIVLGAYLGLGALGTRRAATHVGRTGPAAEPAEPAARTGRLTPGRLTPGRLVGLLGLLVIAVLATAGPQDASSNLTDVVVLTLLWGSVAISSALLGGWWPRVDPLQGLADLLSDGDPAPLPRRTAAAAMAIGLLAWAWAQLFATTSVAIFQALLLAHVVVHVTAAVRWGPTWLIQVEALNVLSQTLALLRPGDGGPLARLVAATDDDRLRWSAGILIGWSLTDLLVETDWWHDNDSALTGTLLLLLATTGTYGLIRAVSGRFRLGPAFAAVAGGWVAAHYLSILLVEGQGVPIWLSDPFGTGADLLGRRSDLIDLQPLPLWVMAVLQSVPFVGGHLLGVVVVQRRAARLATRPGQVGPATFPARALIGALLLGGTWLQLGGV